MIVRELQYLPRFDPMEKLIVDVETTSFDDDVPGFNPFQGCRTCGYAISTVDGNNTWYIPLRHRDGENLPLENTLRYLQDTMGSGRDIVNHNIKFDASFWHFDGVEVKGKLIDTMLLARIWKNDLFRLSLDALTDGGKDPKAKAYLRAIKSKDYGRVPIAILGPYAEKDAKLTADLYRRLRKGIRSECVELVKMEVTLTKLLHEQRLHGISVDWDRLRFVWRESARRALECQDEIDKIAGREVDVGNEKDINELMINELGIEPLSYTDSGKPQWNGACLDQIKHPIAKPLKECSHLCHLISTYCEGWWKRKGDDDRLHPEFNQPGARTGRLSSKNPNFQNVIGEAEEFIIPDEGCWIGGGDYSQIEYRVFAHYTQDNSLIDAFNKNRHMDYHQSLADMLGTPRQFAKTLNFSFIYGMGERKLLKQIAAILTIHAEDANIMGKIRTFMRLGGRAATGTTGLTDVIDSSEYAGIAKEIYARYHKTVPSIRILQKRVQNAVRHRGWIKNYMGRVYNMEGGGSHKALNYLIQGSSADMFKKRLMVALQEMPHIKLITNVHDSVFFSIPKDNFIPDMKQLTTIMEDIDMRVPIVFSEKVGKTNWRDAVEIAVGDTVENVLATTKWPEQKIRERKWSTKK